MTHVARYAFPLHVVTRTNAYPLRQANEALADLLAERFDGAAVMIPERGAIEPGPSTEPTPNGLSHLQDGEGSFAAPRSEREPKEPT